MFEEGNSIRCNLRGKFKKEFGMKKDKLFALDMAAVGDVVDIDLNDDGTGTVYNIEKRKNYLSRKAPRLKGASYRGERLEQIIASNIDKFFVISSVEYPSFNNRVIDRLIVTGESSHIETFLIINKIDLIEKNDITFWIDLYRSIGYKVFTTSALTGEGIDDLKKELSGKINLFLGHSGVGKSSLLNQLFGLELNIGDISTFSSKGTHTTVTSVILSVAKNTYVIDTPGIREIDPYGIKKEDLGHFFIEFSEYINGCKFSTCTHNHEPECAVAKAVEEGKISLERYDSYLKILNTVEEDMIY
ncbi:MAG: ribosome small subunit-dependent GTPase A [Ignavibacteria bacterium RBG_13_36_8]|nr:MAG: ribosome small subunit-dependent GTPase A [Ignavibacteria bacterium RBG_13_36_8]